MGVGGAVYSRVSVAPLTSVPIQYKQGKRSTASTVHTSQPLYLSELMSRYLLPRSLRSSNVNILTSPAGITSNFSSRAFSVSAPSTWNCLPAHIRSIDALSTFKRRLKFHPKIGNSSSLPLPSSHPVPATQIRCHNFWHYINLYVYDM